MKETDIEQMEIMGLNEAAKKLKLSPNALSNLRKRDTTFPLPFETPKSGPIWKSKEIYLYGLRSGRLTEDEFQVPTMWGSSKKIAIVGRARVGKSYIVSMCAEKTLLYRNAFCGGGSDKTACPVNNIFIDTTDDFTSFVEFNSSFHNDFKGILEYEDLCADVEFMNGTQVSLDNTEKLPQFIKKIEEVVGKISDAEKQYQNQNNEKREKKSQNIINVYTKPSDFCKNIMRQTGVKRLEVIDTPGVSGNVEFAKISKSDLYIFVLNDANKDEAKTLEKIVAEIKPYVATSNACFLYRSNGLITTKDKFEKEQKKVEESMQQFEDLFANLRGNIISTAMDILYPAKTCICFPPMDPEDLSLPEELFREKFSEKIIRAFSDDSEKFLREEFDKAIKENKSKVFEYVETILKNIPTHEHSVETTSYLNDFIAEKHDRVKTNDYWRIVNSVNSAYRTEKKLLYDYFQSFNQDNCSEIWQQDTLRYLYHMLSKGITQDRGLGIGTYHTEDSPALTMIAEESVFAEKILGEINNNPNLTQTANYRNALMKNGITSKTWGSVYCTDDNLMIKKLQLIDRCINHIPTNSRYELILCRYIGGLRKITEYTILREFFNTDVECENFIATLRF